MSETNTNTYVKVDVRTNGLSYFSDEPVMLKQNFYNEGLNLIICLGENDPVTGKNKYPKDKRINIILTSDRAACFENVINEFFIPAYCEGRRYSCGIFTNAKKDNLLELCCDDQRNVMLRYSTGIDGNRIPKNIFYFKFKKLPIIENYNPENGEFQIREVDSQMVLFVKCIEAFNTAITNAQGHAEKYYNKYFNDIYMSQIAEIATKLGLVPKVGVNRDSISNSPTTTGSGFNDALPQPYEMTEAKLSDILG